MSITRNILAMQSILAIKKSFGLAALLAGALSLGGFAAENAPERPAPASVPVAARNQQHDQTLAQRISEDFRRDPLFQNYRVAVDLYNGLAIVHGAVPNADALRIVNNKLLGEDGVNVVYNYMSMPDEPGPYSQVDIRYDNFGRIDRMGLENSSVMIAQRVRDRLHADSRLDGFDITVDGYNGLVILHGLVGDEAAATRAKKIAAYTRGVAAVLSYIDVASQPGLAAVTAAPIMIRPAAVYTLPIPAAYETRTATDCGCE